MDTDGQKSILWSFQEEAEPGQAHPNIPRSKPKFGCASHGAKWWIATLMVVYWWFNGGFMVVSWGYKTKKNGDVYKMYPLVMSK